MAAHERSADVWVEQHKPDTAAHEREMARLTEQVTKLTDLPSPRANGVPLDSGPVEG